MGAPVILLSPIFTGKLGFSGPEKVCVLGKKVGQEWDKNENEKTRGHGMTRNPLF